MKTRSGFVSNSSSSSFILYGNTFEPQELVDVMKAGDEFRLATIVGDIDEYRQRVEDDCEEGSTERLNEVASEIFGKFYVDGDSDYLGENGYVRIGLITDPEYLNRDQVLNGLFSKDDVKELEDMAAQYGIKLRVTGGTWYS